VILSLGRNDWMKLFLLVCLGLLLVAGDAAGATTLQREAETLTAVYRRRGATVKRHPSLFLEAGETRRVTLGEGGKGCRTFIALTSRSRAVSMHVQRGPRPLGSARTGKAGAVTFEDCAHLADGLRLSISAGRAAVELLEVQHLGELTDLEVVLPARAVGPIATEGDTAGPMPLAPAAERLARARETATYDGAKLVMPITTQADPEGERGVLLELREGCHRLVLISDQKTTRDPVDVDAEVVDAGTGNRLQRDASHAPDARLDFCLGQAGRVQLRYVGAGAMAKVVVLDALWPIPAGIPRRWGPQTTAGMAWAMHRRPSPRVTAPPEKQFIGGPGSTKVPLRMDPGVCYLAAFAVSRGDASAGRIAVTLGGRTHHDEAAGDQVVGAVSFCAERAEIAQLQLDLRARQGWWVMALWRYGGARP